MKNVRNNLLLIIVLVGIFLLRIPSFWEPYWYGDEGIYLAIGQALQRGAVLYRDIWDNIVVARALKGVSADVEKGDPLTAALSRQPIFPPMMLRMVSAGENTGKIDDMLEKMADFWDEEIEATLGALTSLLEPILIVFLGFIVGGIVIAMFLPIFKLNDVVSANK